MSQMDVKWISQMGQTENLHIFHKAPTVIIVSARKDAVTPIPDCSAAVQNMLLSAESMDIGSCWIGFAKFHFLKIENRKKFNIPENYEVHFGVSLGYKVKTLNLYLEIKMYSITLDDLQNLKNEKI